MLTRLLTTTALCASFASATHAQETFDLDEIIVSGGLTPIAAQNYGRSVSVITAEEIDERGYSTVEDVLRAMASVAVTSTGETATDVRIRGGEANHTLVLIDGVEMNSPSTGAYTFSGLALSDIERIEVLRGAQSAIYGSGAMGGVISITTKKAETAGGSGAAGFEIGSHDSYAATLALRHRSEQGQVSFSLERRQTEGEDLSRSGGDTEYNNRTTATLTMDHALSEQVRIGTLLRVIDQDYGYDATNDDATQPEDYVVDADSTSQRDELTAAIWAEAAFMDGRLLTRLERIVVDQDQKWGDYISTSERRGLKFSGSYALDGGAALDAAHKLNFVLERDVESYTNIYATDTTDRETNSLALEYQGQFTGGFDVQAGLRYDDNALFDNTLSWNLAGSYQLANTDIRLRGAIGTAVVKPSMFEQYGYAPGIYDGNPDLEPEESFGYEIGADLAFAGGRGDLGVTLFHEEIDNLIQGAGTTSVNLDGTSKASGVELSVAYAAADWLDLSTSYSYVKSEDPDGAPLRRRPEHELGLSATARTFGGRGTVTADLRHVRGIYDTPGYTSTEVLELPSFTTLDLAATYDLNDQVELYGKITNVADVDYQEAWGYAAPSRAVALGLRSTW